jgi:hypothetical protein
MSIPTLGTPDDITLQKLRIESLFPADDVTQVSLRTLEAAYWDMID